jgi:copper homeostasis protein
VAPVEPAKRVNPSNSPTIEICVDAVDSALAAQHGGAQRVELCSNLLEGGVTPSAGLIATVLKSVSIPVQVMVRPRGGDFCYSRDEYDVMKQDVLTAKSLRAHGAVFGLLRPDGTVDVERTRELVELARPLPVTFHRAFDVCPDLAGALEDVIGTGADWVLTSGGASSALAGVESLARLVKTGAGRITILAGGGINHKNAREVVEKTGVHELHAGLRSVTPSRAMQSGKNISPRGTGLDETQRFVVLQEDVEKLARALISRDRIH